MRLLCGLNPVTLCITVLFIWVVKKIFFASLLNYTLALKLFKFTLLKVGDKIIINLNNYNIMNVIKIN